MGAPTDVLMALRSEIKWAGYGRVSPKSAERIHWTALDDWSKLNATNLKHPQNTAVLIDGEPYLGDELEEGFNAAFFVERNPRIVAFRMVTEDTETRKSLILIRADLRPSEEDLEKIGYM